VVELGGERLIVGEDERGAVLLGDDGGHGEGLAGAGDAEEHLVFVAGVEAGDELGDGARLVARGFVVGNELEVHPCRIREACTEMCQEVWTWVLSFGW